MSIRKPLLLLTFLTLCACTGNEKTSRNIVHSFLDANIPHLDPIHSTNTYSSSVNASIFEGLFHYHYLKRPIEIEPLLAESFPEVSADGLTYTIKIKKGVYFQDDPAFPKGIGRQLRASDFVYSWKRLADPKNKALGWHLFDGLIEGLNHWRDQMRLNQANYDSLVPGLIAIDEWTLQVRLTRRSFQFIHYLTTAPSMVVAKEVVDHYGEEIANHPVGTGPFRLRVWVRDSKVHLERNKKYRNEYYPEADPKFQTRPDLARPAGQPLPLADEVLIHIFHERQPLWLSFLKGEVDHGVVPKDNYQQIFEKGKLRAEFSGLGVRTHEDVSPEIVYIAFNMEHPILGKNQKLRTAMALAINREMILKRFYNQRGLVAESLIPPGLQAYDKNYKNPNHYNLDKALRLMQEIGHPMGEGLPTFEYELSNNAIWARQFAEYLKAQWKKIGINIRLVPNTWPQFDKKVKLKKVSLFTKAYSADYADSENFLRLFHGKNISPGLNGSNFVHKEYDALYDEALSLPAGEKRDLLFQRMRDIVNDQVPAIFVVHRIFHLPYHDWLNGFYPHPLIKDRLKYLQVDQKRKKMLMRKL